MTMGCLGLCLEVLGRGCRIVEEEFGRVVQARKAGRLRKAQEGSGRAQEGSGRAQEELRKAEV